MANSNNDQLVTYSLRLTVGQLEWLQAFSQHSQIPVVRIIRAAIDDYIEQRELYGSGDIHPLPPGAPAEATANQEQAIKGKRPIISYR